VPSSGGAATTGGGWLFGGPSGTVVVGLAAGSPCFERPDPKYEMNATTTTFDFPRAVEAAINYVEEWAAVTFMELADELNVQVGVPATGEETMTLGCRPLGDGQTQTRLPNPRNVVLWNCGSPELLAVIEAMLADGHVVLERTSVEHYRRGGMQLIEDYDEDQDDCTEVPLPALDFSAEAVAEIDPAGYDTPPWVPVLFAWAG
jgi:hypothetical protein